MSKPGDTFNIMFAGVGGQGLMLLSAILGKAAVDTGLTVMTGEQHGLSQRQGSIYVHFRIGNPISPLIPFGKADMMIAMEASEALSDPRPATWPTWPSAAPPRQCVRTSYPRTITSERPSRP